MTELTTERLELRRWRASDIDDYAVIAADPEVARYLGGPTFDRALTWRQIALFVGHRELKGWTSSAVVERSSGQLIGRGGLWQPEGWPGVEVGWIFARAAWGHGYATELGVAVRDYAFGELGVPHLISVIHPDNQASIRVAEKIGARFEGEADIFGRMAVIYGQIAPTVYGQDGPTAYGQIAPTVYGQDGPTAYGQIAPTVYGPTAPPPAP